MPIVSPSAAAFAAFAAATTAATAAVIGSPTTAPATDAATPAAATADADAADAAAAADAPAIVGATPAAGGAGGSGEAAATVAAPNAPLPGGPPRWHAAWWTDRVAGGGWGGGGLGLLTREVPAGISRGGWRDLVGGGFQEAPARKRRGVGGGSEDGGVCEGGGGREWGGGDDREGRCAGGRWERTGRPPSAGQMAPSGAPAAAAVTASPSKAPAASSARGGRGAGGRGGEERRGVNPSMAEAGGVSTRRAGDGGWPSVCTYIRRYRFGVGHGGGRRGRGRRSVGAARGIDAQGNQSTRCEKRGTGQAERVWVGQPTTLGSRPGGGEPGESRTCPAVVSPHRRAIKDGDEHHDATMATMTTRAPASSRAVTW